MKKYFSLILIAVFGFMVTSCTDRANDPVQDNDTYAIAFDLKNVSFTFNTTNGYHITRSFSTPIYSTDVVLIYRQNGTGMNSTPVWQQIPRTVFLTQGELDYDFDFTKDDFMIYAGGTYDISTTPAYINNQTFRVVVVPASAGKNANLDFSDYNAVIKFYNIDETKVAPL